MVRETCPRYNAAPTQAEYEKLKELAEKINQEIS